MKEGYYFGVDLPINHPAVVARKFNLGPNKYPQEVGPNFRPVMDQYFNAMRGLAEKLFRVICKTLEIGDDWVSDFVETPIATLRLLH